MGRLYIYIAKHFDSIYYLLQSGMKATLIEIRKE